MTAMMLKEITNYLGEYVEIVGAGKGGSEGTFVGRPMLLERNFEFSSKQCLGVTLVSGRPGDPGTGGEQFLFHMDSLFTVLDYDEYHAKIEKDREKASAPKMRFEANEQPNHDRLSVEFLVRGNDLLPLTTKERDPEEEGYEFVPTYGEVYFEEGRLSSLILSGQLTLWPGRTGYRSWGPDEILNAPEHVRDAFSVLVGTNRAIHEHINKER